MQLQKFSENKTTLIEKKDNRKKREIFFQHFFPIEHFFEKILFF